jgi:uncharacterized protein YqjF (DUF2071 family)
VEETKISPLKQWLTSRFCVRGHEVGLDYWVSDEKKWRLTNQSSGWLTATADFSRSV